MARVIEPERENLLLWGLWAKLESSALLLLCTVHTKPRRALGTPVKEPINAQDTTQPFLLGSQREAPAPNLDVSPAPRTF